MKTKFITLGYGILLATFSNLIEAEPKDGEDVAQPSEAARFIAEVLQVQLRPNFIDVTLPWNYELNVLLTERQILALKYLCTQLGPQFGCDSIHPHTPLAKDLAALCDAYNPDSHYDFLLREPAPIHQDAFFREVFKSLSEKVKKQAETIKKLEAEKNDINEKVEALKQETNKVTEVNKQLTARTQQAEKRASDLQKANELSSAEVQKLNTQLEEAQSKVQTITKEITVLRTQTVGVDAAIQAVQKLPMMQSQKDKVMSVLSSLKKGSIK